MATTPSFLPSNDIPQSANLQLRGNKTHSPNPSKTSAIAVVVGGAFAGLFAFLWYCRRKQKIGSIFELSDSRMSTDQAKEFCRKSASPLINLEYSNGWDPLADGRSGVGFSQEVL
ncbi:hypothetical protein MRB53_013519 [Persea americana]|uniref:Uncharacterized protein n=1 Tax=Persea americana TaxID=3435 RepID=A0ACC2K868_PERAE|nr:hypothetical protein MRB53_013519 [Persea americana]